MPFKLLKKTRQYNVASKSLFVISVELLDGGVADCTLSIDSTGQECLDNVCQRQAINQPEFFGLRYVNRQQQPQWVQLERPLKRQLDKYASSHQLYLRVMYYIISGTSLITDEVTRYHYFLQLKNDLVEGRIICDCQQAVVLASYSRQAEYGNHDRDRHTVEYLKNLLTFPKQMLDNGQLIDASTLAETGKLEWLTAAVIQHHMALHNMSQAQAEEGFITTCQQLRGYGQELFAARDANSNSEVTIAVSLTGIRVLSEHSDTPHFYRWMDITIVINRKRTFSIECLNARESASFVLPSPEAGKCVWRCCVLQHTFHMRHQQALTERSDRSDRSAPAHPVINFQQEIGLSDSREELDSREASSSRLEPLGPAHRAHSTSCLELRDALPPRARVQLPQYRPAPDYETAVQQKHQQQRAEAQLRYQGLAPALPAPPAPAAGPPAAPPAHGSHPDVRRGARAAYGDARAGPQAATDDYLYGLKYMATNYPLVNNIHTDFNQMHYVNVYKPPPPYPSNGLASNSTPDLAVASQALNYHRGYINAHVSGSSPDLVSTRTALNRQYLGYLNSGTHNMVNYRPNVMPGAHGTYNNLNSVLNHNPHHIMDPHHISDNIQKVYDERGNIMYSMPMHRLNYQRHLVLPQQQLASAKISDAQEPIYENVPLPWQSDKITMRDRAQSLTTTDEINRINERNGSHPNINQYGNHSKPNLNVPYQMKVEPDSHYVNAQIIKGVRESSVPKDLNVSNRSINNNKQEEFENIALTIDKISLKDDNNYDETPYQSLSTHLVSNNNTISKSTDNVTSISVPDIRVNDTALSSSVMNSTYSTSVEMDATKSSVNSVSVNSVNSVSSVSSKEKKRRRWGVFMGRGKEVKSATLGRDKAKPPPQPANKHRWSTGLPKFQPLPPSITKETMCQLLERKMSDEQLSFAFEQIPKGRAAGGSVRTALLPQHAALNGPGDALPYEDNRVKLQATPANPHGYMNASHVTMTVGNTQRFYVVAKVDTHVPAEMVWECAWQVGSRILARVGAARPHYLPPDDSTADFGQYQVTAMRESRAAWGGSIQLRVRCGTRSRTVWHVHYRLWRDAQPAPDHVDHFLEFLAELNALRLACSSLSLGLGAHNAPLLASCARGALAGTALAAALLLHVVDCNQELDIPRTIGLLHQQRANLIQNVHQYKFLHQLLLHYLKQSRLI